MKPVVFTGIGANCKADSASPGVTLRHTGPGPETEIIIDAPPVLAVTDPVVLGRAAGAVSGGHREARGGRPRV